MSIINDNQPDKAGGAETFFLREQINNRDQMQDIEETISITRRAYGVFAQTYHERFKGELSQKAYDRKLLDRYAQYFSPQSIIYDAGCGPSGHIGRYLFDKGLAVRGLDISEHCIDIARKYNPDMKFE